MRRIGGKLLLMVCLLSLLGIALLVASVVWRHLGRVEGMKNDIFLFAAHSRWEANGDIEHVKEILNNIDVNALSDEARMAYHSFEGDMYSSEGRYGDAIEAYGRALSFFHSRLVEGTSALWYDAYFANRKIDMLSENRMWDSEEIRRELKLLVHEVENDFPSETRTWTAGTKLRTLQEYRDGARAEHIPTAGNGSMIDRR